MTRSRFFTGTVAGTLALLGGVGHAADIEARIEASPRVNLSTAVSGVISEIPAVIGLSVKAGDVLLRLDNGILRARVDAARADVAHREAQLKESTLERQRLAELNERKMLAEHELAMGDIALSEAKYRLATARATLAQAEHDLIYSEIRAPFDGTVLARHAEIGQFVQINAQVSPLIEFGAPSRIAARAVIPTAQAASLTPGTLVMVGAGIKHFSGVVSARYGGPRAETTTLTVLFDPKDSKLAPGNKVTLELP